MRDTTTPRCRTEGSNTNCHPTPHVAILTSPCVLGMVRRKTTTESPAPPQESKPPTGQSSCRYRRQMALAKARRRDRRRPTYLHTRTHKFIAPHFGSRFQLQILSVNTDSNVEGASIRSPTIFTVAIVRRADPTGITQCDPAAQARRFKMLVHVIQPAFRLMLEPSHA